MVSKSPAGAPPPLAATRWTIRPSIKGNDDRDLSGAAQDMQALFEIGRRVADDDSRPQWKDGSEFKALRQPPWRVISTLHPPCSFFPVRPKISSRHPKNGPAIRSSCNDRHAICIARVLLYAQPNS